MKKIMLILVVLAMQFTNIYAGENEFVTKWTVYRADSNHNLISQKPAAKIVFTIIGNRLDVKWNNYKNLYTFQVNGCKVRDSLFYYNEKAGEYFGYTYKTTEYAPKADMTVISVGNLNNKRCLMFIAKCKNIKEWKWDFEYFVIVKNK